MWLLSSEIIHCTCVCEILLISTKMNSAELKPMIYNLSPIAIYFTSHKTPLYLHPTSRINYIPSILSSSSESTLHQVFSESIQSSCSVFIFASLLIRWSILLLKKFSVTSYLVTGYYYFLFSIFFIRSQIFIAHCFLLTTFMNRKLIKLILMLVSFICSFGSLKDRLSLSMLCTKNSLCIQLISTRRLFQ